MILYVTLWLLFTLAKKGSGHRGGGSNIAIIEASCVVENFEHESHVVPQDAITLAERNDTGPRVSPLPKKEPILTKGVPPKPLTRSLLTSSFMDSVHGALSVLMSQHTEPVHGIEVPQLPLKRILYTSVVFGSLLFCCFWCIMVAQRGEDSLPARSSTGNSVSAVSNVSNQRSMDGQSSGRNAGSFKRLKKFFRTFDPRVDEHAEGDKETPEDRVARIIGKHSSQ